MKKIILALIFASASALAMAQTTSIDFTKKDCDGVSQTLYDILKQGQVAVLVYEHQCPSCLQGMKTIKKVIDNNFAANDKIKILYLDNGANSCNATKKWVEKNAFPKGLYFKYANDFSTPYGAGMPVIVITAGINHQIFFKSTSPAETEEGKVINALNEALKAVEQK